MTYDTFDVVVVPFPFTDRSSTKRCPALVVSRHESFSAIIGHSVLAMITSTANAPWPLDVPITDGGSAGLKAASVVRMKLFTLDQQLILKRSGALSAKDRSAVTTSLRKLLVT